MAQCFVSTYRNHYRWPERQVTLPIKPEDRFMSVIPSEDIWTANEANDDNADNDEAFEKRLRRCYLKRMITTYQFDYCKDLIAKLLGESADTEFENQLLKEAKNLYEPTSRPKIAPPSAGTRKVFGYIRPTGNYTPLTNYQLCHGLLGYRLLKGDFKKSKEGSPQEEIEAQLETTKEEKKQKEEKLCDCKCCVKERCKKRRKKKKRE